jgi:2-methylcitrate dehydratase PrpD
LADTVDGSALRSGSWENDWELELNTFKPYPCGIVSHPVIDAAIAACAQVGSPAAITAVSIACNPLVPELMGRRQPADGLQARFSSYHTAAAGLLDGEVGLAQFRDDWVTTDEVARLRGLITLRPDSSCARDAATIKVERHGADPVVVHVPHARGSLARPLTDSELLSKVDRLVAPVLGDSAAAEIRRAVDALPGAPGLSPLLSSIRPASEAGDLA